MHTNFVNTFNQYYSDIHKTLKVCGTMKTNVYDIINQVFSSMSIKCSHNLLILQTPVSLKIASMNVNARNYSNNCKQVCGKEKQTLQNNDSRPNDCIQYDGSTCERAVK